MMRVPTEKIHNWIISNQEYGWKIEINDLVKLLVSNKVIDYSEGTIKARIYELSKEFPNFIISKQSGKGVLIYNQEVELDNVPPSPQSKENLHKINEFFDWKEKELLSQLNPEEDIIVVNLHDVFNFDTDLFDWVLSDPEKARSLLSDKINNMDDVGVDKRIIQVKFNNAYPPAEMPHICRQLNASLLGKVSTLHAVPTMVDSAKPTVDVGVFLCVKCREIHRVKQDRLDYVDSPSCCRACKKTDFRFLPEQSTWIDSQRIELTEPLSRLEGSAGESLKSIICGQTHIVSVGEECEFTGVFKVVPPKKKGRIYDKMFLIDSIRKSTIKLDINKEDEEIIQDYAKDKNILKLLEETIAPFIYGYNEVKLAGALQLFGCPSIRFQGDRKRGNIHVLLIGDPAVSKSKLLQYLSYLSPKSVYVSGKGASAAGITAVAEQTEGGGWRLKAGAMVLASKGLLCIDEFNECDKDVQKGLNEGMESGSISIAKAGITTSLCAETNVLAAANPVLERFDSYKPLSEQFGIPPTTLSRFDLIFPVRDVLDSEQDKRISARIIQGWRKEFEDYAGEIDIDLLRKYIQYAQTIEPVLSEEAGEKIGEYYVQVRKSSTGAVPITARATESIIRLSTAVARIKLREEVLVGDVDVALDLYNYTLQQVATTENGTLDIDMVVTGHPKSVRDKIQVVEGIMRELIGASDSGHASLESILGEALSKGFSKFEVDKIILEMKTKGIIYEPKHGEFIFTDG